MDKVVGGKTHQSLDRDKYAENASEIVVDECGDCITETTLDHNSFH